MKYAGTSSDNSTSAHLDTHIDVSTRAYPSLFMQRYGSYDETRSSIIDLLRRMTCRADIGILRKTGIALQRDECLIVDNRIGANATASL